MRAYSCYMTLRTHLHLHPRQSAVLLRMVSRVRELPVRWRVSVVVCVCVHRYLSVFVCLYVFVYVSMRTLVHGEGETSEGGNGQK